MFDRYLDKSVTLTPTAIPDQGGPLGALEWALSSPQENRPIPLYVNALRQLRKASQGISGHRDEIQFSRTVQSRLSDLSNELGLHETHFQIINDGDPLIVKEAAGEHLISPTHFENGAYFSHPHADHQLDYGAQQLPKIQVGRYVRFGRNAAINAGGDVRIGDGAWLSPGSQLLRQDHDPYGRLSIGSRTVAMTRLPPVLLCDYAWVGREAIVGWNADYLGKGSIVGLRSFVNSWVGDYSIVGDQGKILQYLPYKSWLMESFQPTVEQTLQISDWEVVNADWLIAYRDEEPLDCETPTELKAVLKELDGQACALLVGPDAQRMAPWFADRATDIISDSRVGFARLLQWAQDAGQRRLRVRADLNAEALPFVTGGHYHYRRKLGYGVVVVSAVEGQPPTTVVKEALRVCAPGGLLLYPLTALNILGDSASALFIRRADIKLGHLEFACLEKV